MPVNPKQILIGSESREKLFRGIERVYEVVSTTLGPRGSTVAIDREWGEPIVVGDGVTVAREIELKDRFEDMGAQLVKGAASRTNDIGGDGTTGATILTYAIAKEALKNVAAGANARIMRKGIEKSVEAVVSFLESKAKKVETDEQVRQIATISAQNDEIGELVSNAIKKLGRKAVITVEESKSSLTSIEYKEGLQFDQGFMNPYFMTNEAFKEAVIDNAHLMIFDGKLNDLQSFVPVIDNLIKNDHANNFVIVAEEISPQILAILLANKLKGTLNCLAIQSPYNAERRRAFLGDLAVLTGATIISGESGLSLKDVKFEHLGRCGNVTSTDKSTVITDGMGEKTDLEARLAGIEKELENLDISEFDRERLLERQAKLTSGIAVINVGASSETEMREKKERVIDATSATRAAIEEGIVPGGETALLWAREALDGIAVQSDEERLGVKIVREALEFPFRRLMDNSGYDPGKMLGLFEGKAKWGEGIDVIDGQLKDLFKAGIIDPVKVVRSMLENAASVATMVMTTNASITPEPKPEKGNDN